MGRPNKKSRLIAGRRTDAETFGGCKGLNDKHPAGAENERSFLKYCSDDSDVTSNSKITMEEICFWKRWGRKGLLPWSKQTKITSGQFNVLLGYS